MSFLDKTGLSHFWAQCLNKFATKDAIPSVEGLASETYVDNKVASMVDSAPETLNTLNELAAALGDDPNFATTVATEIGGKVNRSGDTMTGELVAPTIYAKGTYPNHAFMNADGTPVVLMQVDASKHRLGIHQKRGGTSVWESNEAYFLPAPNLDQTTTVAYDILTNKSPVTIAQGGTEATTRQAGFLNLAFIGNNPITSTEDDTPTKWTELGSGYARFSQNYVIDQPYIYGILINYAYYQDVTQIWLSLSAHHKLYTRSGNASGWFSSWIAVYDTVNKPTAADIGALPLNPASIEMYAGASANHGGFIDFHYNGSTSDHTSRIIESSSSVLDINYVSGGKVRLGTVTTGTWNGSAIPVAHGGTGVTSHADTTYTTARYRASSLNSTETTPAVNGVISWTYE